MSLYNLEHYNTDSELQTFSLILFSLLVDGKLQSVAICYES